MTSVNPPGHAGGASARLSPIGAAPRPHAHDHLHVLWTLEGTLELEVEGCGLRLPAGHGGGIRARAHPAPHAPPGARRFILDTPHPRPVGRPAPPAGGGGCAPR